MNKVIFYTVLIASYLVLSKTFNPDNSGVEYIRTSEELNKIIFRVPSEAILLQTLSKGFLIKTYYQRYKIVYGFHPPREIVVRTRRSHAENTKKYLGMSVFRKHSSGFFETLPLPPGSQFIGNRQFGRWVFKNKEYYWTFYRAYKDFPRLFGWNNFNATKSFFNELKQHRENKIPFLGTQNEFGESGKITQSFVKIPKNKSGLDAIRFKTLFTEYLKVNYSY